MSYKDYIKKKYLKKRYKIWEWNKTVIVYDKKTKKRFSLNKEIQKAKDKEGNLKRDKVPLKEYKDRNTKRKGLSLRYSHLFVCDCIVKRNKYYQDRGLPSSVEHHFAYESKSIVPRYKRCRTLHDKHYPNHKLQKIIFKNTKRPTFT